jgi:hypothetical protein
MPWQQQPAAGRQPARVVEVDKLDDNLYMMRGAAAKCCLHHVRRRGGWSIRRAGAGGALLRDLIVTDQAVRNINTHTHGDQ